MTKKIYRILLPLAAACCLTACQSGLLSRLGVDDPTSLFETSGLPGIRTADTGNQEKMVVNRIDFAPDYKTFSIWTGVVSDIGPYPLTDSTVVRIEVEEYDDGVRTSRRVQPQLVRAWNTESDQVKDLGIKILVLVDLSLPQSQVDAEREAVKEMMTVFNQDNLFVSFMSGSSVTPSMVATDYVLNEYFKKGDGTKRLYRSILAKIRELARGDEPWLDATQKKLVVFSDAKVYDENDQPLDPDHFEMANEMLHSQTLDDEAVNVFYVNFGKGVETGEDGDAANVLTSLCESTGGASLPGFNWTLLENTMLGSYSRDIASNRFDFVNPDGKIYRGDDNQLKILFYSVKDNHLIASATAHIHEGTLYRPIIVNGDSLLSVIIEGVSLGLLLMLAIYLICQLLIPYVRYRWFLHKYVIDYSGSKMVVEGIEAGESCYYCKAPFVKGDKVVVKCEHTMHLSCWDENEYHCPEYGRHCKTGSHFYDKEHLFDRRNASFYMRWLLMAVVAAICAWVAFSVWTHFTSRHILEYLIPVEYLSAGDSGSHLNQLPSYGFMIGFFLTFGIAFMATRKKHVLAYVNFLVRALIAGIGSSILYLLTSAAAIAFHVKEAGFIINLIPWTLSSFLIAIVATYGTRVRLNKKIILIAVGVSMVSMYLWSYLYMYIGIDYRVLLLFSYMIYAIGMVVSIACAAPKSEHFFLNVQGPVKTMDIALYKWFRANPNTVVSIGKSVDCSLQLTWDLQSSVAPVHAELSMKKGEPRLIALEDGVTMSGKPLKVDRPVFLYHGARFQIGQTLFTYLEKDI